jgi:hypothetical protein
MIVLARRDVQTNVFCGLLLTSCSATSPAQRILNNQGHLETCACERSSLTPSTGTGSFEVVSVQDSTLMALKKVASRSLQTVVRNYVSAGRSTTERSMTWPWLEDGDVVTESSPGDRSA